ncbi:MAG: hypothetical protein KAS12_06245, partial [Candidatus Aenigmarchaeota archaeon]|nr:hypothetical protein [Candidatus Aenigmarchaeota archaeon]
GKGFCPVVETICDDGIDNDLDGDFDCADSNCNDKVGPGGVFCTADEGGIDMCSNSYTSPAAPYSVGHAADDDNDGAANCYDDGCYKKGGICGVCPDSEDYTIDSCADGIDNELEIMGISYYSTTGAYNPNGYSTDGTDCSDSNCTSKPGPTGSLCGVSETDCTDEIDNDMDGTTDCDDSNCNSDSACILPSANTVGCSGACDSIGTIVKTTEFGSGNQLKIIYNQYVHRGDNLTVRFINQSEITVSNPKFVVGKIGATRIPTIFNASPSNTYIEGTIVGCGKSVDLTESKSIGAECGSETSTDGADISVVITIPENDIVVDTADTYTFSIIADMITGDLIEGVITVDVLENEKPTSNVRTPIEGYEINRTSTGDVIVFNINATDVVGNTYNSGIDKCQVSIDAPGSWINDNDCDYTLTINEDGNHTIYYRAIDEAGNIEDYNNITFNITTIPVQTGGFYDTNISNPIKRHYDSTELIQFGVNFTSNYAFTSGNCSVWFENGSNLVFAKNVTLTPYGSGNKYANCVASIDLTEIPDKSYRSIAVKVKDTNGREATSLKTFRFFKCSHKDVLGTTICMDACESNAPPIFENVSLNPIPARRNFNLSFEINISDGDSGVLGELNTESYPRVWFKKPGES